MFTSKKSIQIFLMTLTFTFGSLFGLIAQNDKIIQRGDFYYHQKLKYKIGELEYIIKDNKKAYALYLDGQKKRRTAITTGVIGGVGVAIGLSIVLSSNNTETGGLLGFVYDDLTNTLVKTIGYGIMVIGGSLLTVTIIKSNSSNAAMRSAIQIYNEELPTQNTDTSLHLKTNGMGIGLVYKF